MAGGTTDVLGETARVCLKLVRPREDSAGLLMREDESVDVTCRVKESLTAPVERGMIVGTVEYSVDGTVYRREDIVTADAVEKIDLRWCVVQVLKRFLM